ncbi:MAG: hypothetical protein IPM70_11155 [Proteobacteria bacterium]|nr:hypothetical protein [Pseudomonadota bacterium]
MKVRQVAGRLLFRLGALRPRIRPAPTLRAAAGQWILPARREQSLFPGLLFRFLNEERALEDCGWDSPAVPRLWRYNLHYFEDLNARGSQKRRDLQAQAVNRWIAENPPVEGSGWEPYPTSLRVVNWIKWLRNGEPPDTAWLASLAHQVRWLERRLEWHLLGNHLFVNAKALFIAGLYFEGEEANRWRNRGVSILTRQLAEQVLADGGQFERTPMYHRLAWEDVLDPAGILAVLWRAGSSGVRAS